jgi:hypothetical protein
MVINPFSRKYFFVLIYCMLLYLQPLLKATIWPLRGYIRCILSDKPRKVYITLVLKLMYVRFVNNPEAICQPIVSETFFENMLYG